MEASASVQAASQTLAQEKGVLAPGSYGMDGKSHLTEDPELSINDGKDENGDKLRWNQVTVGFFLIGLLLKIGLPSMVVTTGANEMFTGMTGVYEVCASLTGAITSLVTPFFARFISYNNCTMICIFASLLSYVICTLPQPLDNSSGDSKAGPVIGVALAGFVYAFGTNVYMAVAAFFPPQAVLAMSAGSGFSVILGPVLYIAFMFAFGQDWRRTFLVLLPTVLGIPIVWWTLMDKSRIAAAEQSRIGELEKKTTTSSSITTEEVGGDADDTEATVGMRTDEQGIHQGSKPGFGPQRTRVGLLFKTIVPKYVLPLIICTSSAIVTLLGTSPTLQALERYRARPQGDLQFQLVFLSYGIAQFLFSALTSIYPVPIIWFWTGAQVTILVIGIIQIFNPFLTYYGVWIVFLFLVGACVGGGVTNTNYKIARDFQRAGEPDEVRSFAMSYAGLGNFGGDAIGGALATMVQQLSLQHLKPRS